MVLNRDEGFGAGRARVVDSKSDTNGVVVVYRSDFDAGWDGWTDHWTGTPAKPYTPLSLTSAMQNRGGRCLMLSTGEGSYSASAWDNIAYAWKRLGLYTSKRYHSVSAWVAVGEGGSSGAWSQWEILLDQQAFDNSKRSLYHLRVAVRPGPDYSRLEITNDAGASVTVPSSTHKALGLNENKWGMNYIRLTIDTQANSGLGGYLEAQINSSVFDLSGLGAGSAIQAIQGDNGSGSGAEVNEFNGGSNIGFSLTRNNATGGAQLFVDDVVYAVSDTWA